MRKILLKNYGHVLVPPLPPKKNKYDDKNNAKRARKLERFINSVLRSEDLKTFPFLVEFLSVPIEDQGGKWLPRRLKDEQEA